MTLRYRPREGRGKDMELDAVRDKKSAFLCWRKALAVTVVVIVLTEWLLRYGK
jgi:hypothetical protein